MPGRDAAGHQHRDPRDRDLGLTPRRSQPVAGVRHGLEERPFIAQAETRFSFEIESIGWARQELLIDYAVHFVKANGLTRAKVFKLRRLVLAPASRVKLGDSISLKPMTTRRQYPGRHRIDLLINGVVHPLAEFEVR